LLAGIAASSSRWLSFLEVLAMSRLSDADYRSVIFLDSGDYVFVFNTSVFTLRAEAPYSWTMFLYSFIYTPMP